MAKSALKALEKDIGKVEKNIKRNWKKIILIAGISIVVISLILFMAGLRIRFALKDDLIIRLMPSEGSFTINNDQNQDITFHISIEDSMFCMANCSYAFYDRSNEETLGKGSLTLKDGIYFNKTYRLTPYRVGSGQKIYNFDIQCSNIKSFLCKTESPVRQKSSFITLNYRLTEKEEKLKAELKPIITKSFILINNASGDLQRSYYILNETKALIEFDSLSSGHLALYKKLAEALEQANEIFGLWAEENYIGLSWYRASWANSSNWLRAKSNIILNDTITSVNEQNKLLEGYNKIKNYFFNISESQERYVYSSASKESIKEEFDIVYNYSESISSKLSGKEYISLSHLEEDLANISALISRFNKTLNSNYDLIASRGKNLSSFEYSKKCYLGYCGNITDNICFELDKIFMEYQESSYNASVNISDIPYYIKVNETIRILISNESKEYYSSYCSNLTNISYFPADIADAEELKLADIYNISLEVPIRNELTENPPVCCVYGKCSPCCAGEECMNDPKLYPVVLIHGHSLLKGASPESLLDTFSKAQYQLQEDDYINAGVIRFDFNSSDYKSNEWGLSGFPVAVKASYYYDYFYYLGKYIYITRNADNLDTYAIRLNEIVELVKYRTGKPKVNIIAHSMGGLVARRYIQIFGGDSVDKLILIAVPNKGIEGSAKKLCHIFGEKRECEDMYSDSVFIKKLNDPNYRPKNVKFYTVSGKGCKTNDEDGDGVVTFESSALDYASQFAVNGVCDDAFKRNLHSDLVDIDKYPEVYGYIKGILER